MKLYYHPASTTSRIVQMIALGGLVRSSYSAYPNIERWSAARRRQTASVP